MKKGMGLSQNKVDEHTKYSKVIEEEENNEVAKKGNGAIFFTSACVLAAAIIVCSSLASTNKREDNKKDNKVKNEISITTDLSNNNDVMQKVEIDNTSSEISEEVQEDSIDREIDYSNASTFYNHIIDNRNKYGSFAESFQSEEDVKNFINFLYKFNELYSNMDITSTIDSQEMYDKVIQDYYGSCVKHDIKGELSQLYNSNKLAQAKIAEAETLAFDLKNGKGKDYTIANRYYTWFLVNLIDDRTKVDATTNNAPMIDALREQFEQYRYSGNMLEARKYQKNDSLPVESIHLYYADEPESGVQITEVENSLTCPDWGVDNVISKYEEDTEKKLYIKRDGQGTFYRVDEQFEMVINKGKVK